MSYAITLYRREVKSMEQASTDEDFFDRESSFPAFTTQQQQDLHNRLLAYKYTVTVRTTAYTEYQQIDYAISVMLFTTSLTFSTNGPDNDTCFELLQTSTEFTDTGEFSAYNWQEGIWAAE